MPDAKVVQICCKSCECIVEQESAECRAIQTHDKLYESLPVDLIRQVLVTAADEVEGDTQSSSKCCG